MRIKSECSERIHAFVNCCMSKVPRGKDQNILIIAFLHFFSSEYSNILNSDAKKVKLLVSRA